MTSEPLPPIDRPLKLEAFLPYRLSVLANTLSRLVAQTYEHRYVLSVGEWRLLAVLARFGPLSANQVCARTAMDKVRVSRAVSRAVRRGLVDRRVAAKDRRRRPGERRGGNEGGSTSRSR